MGDFIKLRVNILGPEAVLDAVWERHFAAGSFDYNSVCRMPAELNVETGSCFETGYAALFGDWLEVVRYWMFKEPAQALGVPWPLESRQDVIDCIRTFDCADMYFGPARQYQQNMERYGHGNACSWMKEFWGADCNGNHGPLESARQPEVLHLRSNVGTYPKLVYRKMSQSSPELTFVIAYLTEYERTGRAFSIRAGKEVEKLKLPIEELRSRVHTKPDGSSWSVP